PDRAPPDLRPVLHAELDRLPEKYRAPVVLCYLEGKTNEEAARQLRWPVGTVKTRLTRARALLRRRLIGRGVALSVGGLAATLSSGAASAQVPAQLTAATVQAALGNAAGSAGAGISASVTVLVEGMLRELFLAKMKATGLALVMLAAVVLGVGAVAG